MHKKSKNLSSMFAAVTFVVMLCWGGTALGANPIKLLHVSTIMENEVQQTINTTGDTASFAVTQVSLGDFNAGSPSDLSIYDAVVFGISDAYEEISEYGVIGRAVELKAYVSNGGGIVFTHDSLEFNNRDYSGEEDLESIAGVANIGTGWVSGSAGMIVMNHAIMHTPFEVGAIGNLVSLNETHTTGGQITTATPIIRFSSSGNDPNNFYLTIHDYGKGRIAVNEIGHSYNARSAGIDEAKVFVNTLYYVSGIQQRRAVAGCFSLKGFPGANRKVVLKQTGSPDQTTLTDNQGCYTFATVDQSKSFSIILQSNWTPASSPTGIQATAETINSIKIDWQYLPADATFFKVFRKKGATGNWSLVSTAGPDDRSYTDPAAFHNDSNTYYYYIKGCNAAGCSTPSDTVNTAP